MSVVVVDGELKGRFCVDRRVVRAFYGCLPGCYCGQGRRGGTRWFCVGEVTLRGSHENFDRFGTIGTTGAVLAGGVASGGCACYVSAEGVHASLFLEASDGTDLEG